MTSVLTVAVLLVGALGLLNLFIGYGIVRKLRDLDARVGPASGGPVSGHRITPFTATTVDGGPLSEADVASGESLVALLSPGCGSCDEVVAQLSAAPGSRSPILLVHSADADDPETARLVGAARQVGRVAVVPFGDVPQAFGVTSFPTVVLVRDGRVHAAGYDLPELTASAGAR